MFASKSSIKDFALKLPNVAVARVTADACATELAVIESCSEEFRMMLQTQPATLHLAPTPRLPSARPLYSTYLQATPTAYSMHPPTRLSLSPLNRLL